MDNKLLSEKILSVEFGKTRVNTLELKAFVTAAEENSFSLAADKLHLTQPGISKRIQNLENQLKQRLFDRIGRRIFLTEAGTAFLPHAYKLLADAMDAVYAIQNLSETVSGHLSLATTQHIGLHHLAPHIRTYLKQFPEVDFALDFMASERAYDAVLQGRLELAIITRPPNLHDQMDFIPLWSEPLLFVTATDHPLQQTTETDLRTIQHYSGILPGPSTFTRKIVDAVFAKQRLSVNAAVPTNYLEAIKMLVSAGLGWSVLPATLLDDQLESLSVSNVHLQRELGCILHKERTPSNAAKAFLSQLIQTTTTENTKDT